jgi:LPS-assembly protein
VTPEGTLPAARIGLRQLLRAILVLGLWLTRPALAQASMPAPLPSLHVTLVSPATGNAPMLARANKIKYDYPKHSLSAVGNVQIYYGGATVEVDWVVYHQRTDLLRAQGNGTLTEPTGRISHARIIFIHWVRQRRRTQ